jgi:hypothetical protein
MFAVEKSMKVQRIGETTVAKASAKAETNDFPHTHWGVEN